MFKELPKFLNTFFLMMIAFLLGGILIQLMNSTDTVQTVPLASDNQQAVQQTEPSLTPTDAPITPLATLTPSSTLKPPPTFEPPTATVLATATDTSTPTPDLVITAAPLPLRGAETPTPTSTAGCEPREDWTLRYTVAFGDALANIADLYNTSTLILAEGNCLSDPNNIVEGQVLRVPGDAPPVVPAVECVPYQLLTPFDGTMAIEGDGEVTFSWIGPEAIRNLVRIERPDDPNFRYEQVVELRQNAIVDIGTDLRAEGRYVWYVIPLDENFVQVCPQGGPWYFTKAGAPTFTPTPTENIAPPQPSFLTDVSTGPAPLTVQFFNQSRGEINRYEWDFGDGNVSQDVSPTHTFATPGTYLVTLRAFGPGGEEFTSQLIRVQ